MLRTTATRLSSQALPNEIRHQFSSLLNQLTPLALLLAAGIVLLFLPLTGCGGNSYTSTSTSVTPPTLPQAASLPASCTTATTGSSYTCSISVANGKSPFTWNVTGLPKGLSFSVSADTTTLTISGTPQAPAPAVAIRTLVGSAITPAVTNTTTATVQIKVTDASGNSTTLSFSITITTTVATLAVTTTSLPNGTQGASYSATLQASGGTAPITWSISSGSLPSWASLNASTGAITGTPNATGTTSFTVTATDSGTPTPQTASQALSITINAASVCGSGHESVFNGQYAFLFQGFDSNGAVVIAGTFSADGTGKIALLVGVEDINASAGVQTSVAINSAGSSYSVGADNRGCLTIATSSSTSTYAFSLGSLNGSNIATKGRMIEFDTSSTLGSGVLRLQDSTAFSTAAISGNFAFGASSTLGVSLTVRNRFSLAGMLVAAGGAITSGEEDFDLSGNFDNGTTGPVAITSGSYSVSANGRGTLSLTATGAGTFDDSIYIVSATEFFFMNIGAQSATNPVFAGSAVQQSGGPFTTSSFSGNSVFYTLSLCGSCGPSAAPVAPNLSVGVFSVATAGSFSLTEDTNKGGTLSSATATGTYTVDSSGRAVITQTGSGPIAIAYLASPNDGFLVSAGGEGGAGFVEPQTGGPFTAASLTGNFFFGTTGQVDQVVSNGSGVHTYDGLGTVTGTVDETTLGFSPVMGGHFSEPYSVTNGTGTPGRGTFTLKSGGLDMIFYVVSPSKVVLMDASVDTFPFIMIDEK